MTIVAPRRTRRKFIGPEPKGAKGVGRQYQVYPLHKFGLWRHYNIACAVQEDTPPDRWLRVVLAMIPSRAYHEWYWQRGIDPDAQRPAIPSSLRQAVYARDNYRCLHCGAEEGLSLDHIQPYSLDNLQTLCRSCNSRKGARV